MRRRVHRRNGAFRVIVKGAPSTARRHAEDHGVRLSDVKRHPRFDEVTADADADWQALGEWAGEGPYDPPFPAGTLLYYSELRGKEYVANASRATQVLRAAEQGRYAAAGAFHTAGGIVYSYDLAIGDLRGDLIQDFRILDKKRSPSTTTSKHIGYLLREYPRARVVSDLGMERRHRSNPSSYRQTRRENFFRERGATAAQARELAWAENEALDRDWEYEWGDDPEADVSWMDAEQLREYEDGNLEVLAVLLKDEEGEVLASLGGVSIYGDSEGRKHVREVEAELALEALADMGEIG